MELQHITAGIRRAKYHHNNKFQPDLLKLKGSLALLSHKTI